MDIEQADRVIKCANFTIRRTARMINQIFDDALNPIGLRTTQFTTLCVVEGNPGISINKIAEEIGADRTTLTRNLSVLAKEGLVGITKNRSDPRIKEVTITKRGHTLLAAAFPHWEKTQERIISAMGDEVWSAFHTVLKNTNSAIEIGFKEIVFE
jgi:DNA-binding MarR family transcriptional regulator